jgi:hypothetical protein
MDILDILKKVVSGVENNNDINDGKWSDWEWTEILEVYDINNYFDKLSKKEQKIVLNFLDKATKENGQNIIADYKKIEYKVLGFNYQYPSDKFWLE